jgi:hypothetical protein
MCSKRDQQPGSGEGGGNVKQISVPGRSYILPYDVSNPSDPAWIAHELERLQLLLPQASHAATNDLLSCALAYVEHYQCDVLQLEHEWEFLYAALIAAWQQAQHAIVIRLVSSLAHIVGRLRTSTVAEHILRLGIGASRRIQDWLPAFFTRQVQAGLEDLVQKSGAGCGYRFLVGPLGTAL